MMIAFTGTLILPDRLQEESIVVCQDARIIAFGRKGEISIPFAAEVIPWEHGYISPGFVDLHVHGGGGADYMDGDPEAVMMANRIHARHGTTTIFPTTTTGSEQEIAAMLRACRKVRDSWSPPDGARIGGVHFYGPYFAEDKVGAHPEQGRRDPDPQEYLRHFEQGIIRIATCAAELPGATEFCREATRRGYLVTCGHSNASWSEMQRVFDVGMRHVDHFWCAMSSIPSVRKRFGTPMQGSMEQFVVMNRAMSTEVIADGAHLSPELLQYAFSVLGVSRLCLVTDSNRALDMPPGEYTIGPEHYEACFQTDGKVARHRNGGLASSMSGMDTMIKTMRASTDATIPEIIRMASLTPATRVGIQSQVGSLEVGKRADLVLLSSELDVVQTYLGGMRAQPTAEVFAVSA